jgi:group I intron endonuclease
MIYGVIYVATNTVNGKQYVGQTTARRPVRRWNSHLQRAHKGGGHPLYCSMRKHGASAFVFSVIGIADDQKSLDNLEQSFILSLNTIAPNGYNLKNGGGGGLHSEEFKARMTALRNLPEQKALQSERQKIAQNRPEVREIRNIGIKAAWDRPGAKRRRIAIMKHAYPVVTHSYYPWYLAPAG